MGKRILLLAIAASLTWPGITLGQPSLDVGINGLPGGTIVAGSEPITIDVLLTWALFPLDGAQYNLSADLNGMGPGSGDHLVTYDSVTPWTNGTVWLIGAYTQLIGWGAGNGQTMQAVNSMGPELYFETFGYTTGPWDNDPVAHYKIHVAPLNIGDRLVITAGADPANMFGNGYMNGPYQSGPWQPGLGLTIIPEPASLLLLMGAAPFLRRRR